MATSEDLSTVLARSLSARCERVRSRVHALVEPLSVEQPWRRPFRGGIFVRSVAHADHHLGQMIDLCKELTGR